jgi:immunity protein 53 of polymorphic toxin system
MNNTLEWLQNWYLSQCDSDWEHEYGVKIETLDNPGWSISIDLVGTQLENKLFTPINHQKDEQNWLQCSVVNNQFKGAGSALNLIKIVDIFRQWAEQINIKYNDEA